MRRWYWLLHIGVIEAPVCSKQSRRGVVQSSRPVMVADPAAADGIAGAMIKADEMEREAASRHGAADGLIGTDDHDVRVGVAYFSRENGGGTLMLANKLQSVVSGIRNNISKIFHLMNRFLSKIASLRRLYDDFVKLV